MSLIGLQELFDLNALPPVRTCLSLAIIDKDRLALGTEEGLCCVELDRDLVIKVGDNKRVDNIYFVPEEQLLIVITGEFHYSSHIFSCSLYYIF